MVLQCLYVKTGNQKTNTSNCLNETVWRKQIDINRTVWKQKKIQQKTSAIVHALNILQTKKKCSRKKKKTAQFFYMQIYVKTTKVLVSAKQEITIVTLQIKKNTACRTE